MSSDEQVPTPPSARIKSLKLEGWPDSEPQVHDTGKKCPVCGGRIIFTTWEHLDQDMPMKEELLVGGNRPSRSVPNVVKQRSPCYCEKCNPLNVACVEGGTISPERFSGGVKRS